MRYFLDFQLLTKLHKFEKIPRKIILSFENSSINSIKALVQCYGALCRKSYSIPALRINVAATFIKKNKSWPLPDCTFLISLCFLTNIFQIFFFKENTIGGMTLHFSLRFLVKFRCCEKIKIFEKISNLF